MKPAPFNYVRAETLQHALIALSSGEARVLSGGMSLIPLLKLRLAACDALVDISRLPELELLVVGDDGIRIGATITVASLIEDERLSDAVPAIGHILSYVGSPQIRSKATFVGALCHADPASEALLIALLFDGSVRLLSVAGVRHMKVSEFVTAPLVNSAKMDEIVTEANLSRPAGQTAFGFRCHAPRPGDYSVCAAAVLLARASATESFQASIVVAGIDQLPVRLTSAERALERDGFSENVVEEAVMICKAACVLSDSQGSVDYRARLAASLLAGAIADAAAQLENG